ncbi:hypothetical protein GGR92_004116 [Spirosoma lacussanchae]
MTRKTNRLQKPASKQERQMIRKIHAQPQPTPESQRAMCERVVNEVLG